MLPRFSPIRHPSGPQRISRRNYDHKMSRFRINGNCSASIESPIRAQTEPERNTHAELIRQLGQEFEEFLRRHEPLLGIPSRNIINVPQQTTTTRCSTKSNHFEALSGRVSVNNVTTLGLSVSAHNHYDHRARAPKQQQRRNLLSSSRLSED